MADVIPLRAGRNTSGHCDLNNILLDEEEKFVYNLEYQGQL